MLRSGLKFPGRGALKNPSKHDLMDSNSTILVVDDTPEILRMVCRILSAKNYTVLAANSGPRALEMMMDPPRPDLVLLDVQMPEMDGYEVRKEMSRDARLSPIPTIFVTGRTEEDDEERGLALGAVDYITKPIRPQILLARVKNHIVLKRARDWQQDQTEYLESQVLYRIRESQLIQDVTLRALANLAETRDPETGDHIRRTQSYVEVLARGWARHPRGREEITEQEVEILVKASPLHDIGKVGIPDQILLKPGRLDAAEYEIMKLHTIYGSQALERALQDAAAELSLEPAFAGQRHKLRRGLIILEKAQQIARHHHERWDGHGYPDRLAGYAIPPEARIMAVADVFDALLSRRVYKEPYPLEQAVRIITEGAGTQFQPELVELFLANLPDLRQVADKNAGQPYA